MTHSSEHHRKKLAARAEALHHLHHSAVDGSLHESEFKDSRVSEPKDRDIRYDAGEMPVKDDAADNDNMPITVHSYSKTNRLT